MKTLLIMIAAAFSFSVSGADSSPHGVLGTQTGRFVFGQISAYAASTYMLDTQTGRLWVLALDANTNQVLAPIPFRLVTGRNSLEPLKSDDELKLLQMETSKAGSQPGAPKFQIPTLDDLLKVPSTK